jgi:hypothetical protein
LGFLDCFIRAGIISLYASNKPFFVLAFGLE